MANYKRTFDDAITPISNGTYEEFLYSATPQAQQLWKGPAVEWTIESVDMSDDCNNDDNVSNLLPLQSQQPRLSQPNMQPEHQPNPFDL